MLAFDEEGNPLSINQPENKRVSVTARTDLPPEARALLDTIAGTESPDYHTVYGGRKVKDLSRHPGIATRIASGPNAGKTSSAAGRYQFLQGTWDMQAAKLGLNDFSPESQDVAAWDLAESTYGRRLLADLQSGDPRRLERVGKRLAGQWTSLPSGIEQGQDSNRFATSFFRNLAKYRGGNNAQPATTKSYNSFTDEELVGGLNVPEDATPESLTGGAPATGLAAVPGPQAAKQPDPGIIQAGIEFLKNTGLDVASGTGNLIESGGEVVDWAGKQLAPVSSPLSEGIRQLAPGLKTFGQNLTDAAEYNRSDYGQSVTGPVFGEDWSFSPANIPGAVARSLPGMVAAGGLGSAGLRLTGLMEHAPRVAGWLVKAGVPESVATKVAEYAMSGLPFAGAEAVQAAGDAASQARDEVLNAPEEQLQTVPAYRQAVRAVPGNLSPVERTAQARALLAERASEEAFARVGAANGVVGFLTGGGAPAAIERGMGRSALGRGLQAGGEEALQEGLQSPAEVVAQNTVSREFAKPGLDIYKGASQAAAEGAIVGGLSGAPAGLLSPRKDGQTDPAVEAQNIRNTPIQNLIKRPDYQQVLREIAPKGKRTIETAQAAREELAQRKEAEAIQSAPLGDYRIVAAGDRFQVVNAATNQTVAEYPTQDKALMALEDLQGAGQDSSTTTENADEGQKEGRRRQEVLKPFAVPSVGAATPSDAARQTKADGPQPSMTTPGQIFAPDVPMVKAAEAKAATVEIGRFFKSPDERDAAINNLEAMADDNGKPKGLIRDAIEYGLSPDVVRSLIDGPLRGDDFFDTLDAKVNQAFKANNGLKIGFGQNKPFNDVPAAKGDVLSVRDYYSLLEGLSAEETEWLRKKVKAKKGASLAGIVDALDDKPGIERQAIIDEILANRKQKAKAAPAVTQEAPVDEGDGILTQKDPQTGETLHRMVRVSGDWEYVPKDALTHHQAQARLSSTAGKPLSVAEELKLLDERDAAAETLAKRGWTADQISANSLNMTVDRFKELSGRPGEMAVHSPGYGMSRELFERLTQQKPSKKRKAQSQQAAPEAPPAPAPQANAPAMGDAETLLKANQEKLVALDSKAKVVAARVKQGREARQKLERRGYQLREWEGGEPKSYHFITNVGPYQVAASHPENIGRSVMVNVTDTRIPNDPGVSIKSQYLEGAHGLAALMLGIEHAENRLKQEGGAKAGEQSLPDPVAPEETAPQAKEPVVIPDFVRDELNRYLSNFNEVAQKLKQARNADKQFNGEGRYASEVWDNAKIDDVLQAARGELDKLLSSFSERNRAAAQAYLDERMPKPEEISLTEQEKNFFRKPEPTPATTWNSANRTQRAAMAKAAGLMGKVKVNGKPISQASWDELPVDAKRALSGEKVNEPAPTPAPPTYTDPRLKRDVYRLALPMMARDLTEGGDVSYIKDEHGKIVGRTQSINPDWFKNMPVADKLSVKQAKAAMLKASKGEKLGVREARFVGHVLDQIQSERASGENVDYAKTRRDEARKFRAALSGLGVPAESTAGYAHEEADYAVDDEHEDRILADLAQQYRDMPDADENWLDGLLEKDIDDTEIIRQLQEAINGRARQESTGDDTTLAQAPADQADQPATVGGDLFGSAYPATKARSDQIALEELQKEKARNRNATQAPPADDGLFALDNRQGDMGFVGGEPVDTWSPETHVKIAADDVSRLRADDVYRLFEELPQEAGKFDDLRVYIINARPDLAATVMDAIDEVGMPERQRENAPNAAEMAAQRDELHAKADKISAYLAKGGTVQLANPRRVLTLNSPDHIRKTQDGVSVAEGRSSKSPDGYRWVSLFPNQVDELVAQTKSAYGSSNTLFTQDAADKARELLRKKLGQLNTGLDPEIVQAGITLAGYHIEAGARSFAAYTQAMLADLGETARPYLRSWYEGARYYPGFNAAADMTPAASIDAGNIGETNVTDQRSSPDLEPDSPAAVTNPVGAEGVQTGRGRDGGTDESGVRQTQGGRGGNGGVRVPGRETALTGESGDLTVYTGATDVSGSTAGNNIDSGSDTDSLTGPSPDHIAATETAKVARSRSEQRTLAEQQAQADAEDHSASTLEAIQRALPVLLPGQQEDVLKAEQRFNQPDGYGMLFTNGTGTGKTFTGLGVIKRFSNRGKNNILIVAPSDEIINAWIKSAAVLNLSINRLASTKDAGQGIVITTYANLGDNNSLVTRDWDLVVADEAHYLAQEKAGTTNTRLSALRAITLHPDGVYSRHAMLNADQIAERDELSSLASVYRKSDNEVLWYEAVGLQEKADKLTKELDDKLKALQAEIASRQGEQRTRSLFLSATPFAYEKTIDWANGYLFDYNEGRASDRDSSRGYNEGNNRDQFFMQHFGYRMRYGTLTEPDAKVDRGLMQRQFNTWLKKRGVLSGRMLDVPHDYDRRFVLVDSAIGSRIDQALDWLNDQEGIAFRDLRQELTETFDYLTRRYLLEAIKANEALSHVREHMGMGRKVVVFHDYKKGGGINPFKFKAGSNNQAAVDAFNQEFADLVNAKWDEMLSPIETFKRAFPDVLLFNGDVPTKQRRANVAKFNDDASGPQVILVQSAAGKEGISLHDTTGKHPRVLFNLGLPTQPTTAIQQEGRIYRVGQKSNAMFRYLNTGTNWERWAFATTIAQRASAAENLASGEQARALKDAFIAGFEESDVYPAGMDGEGLGGKERDRLANEALTEYDRARAFYYGTAKKTAKTKAQEGVDYYATPEPVGLKMVEWLNLRPGDKALEPSAGHGAIARWFPDDVESTAIEPSKALLSRLALVFDGKKLDSTFEDLHVVNKFDGIVMNPPFGVGGKTAIEHVSKAAAHLREGGRLVALIPQGPSADKRLEQWLYAQDDKGQAVHGDLHLVADVVLPSVTFERAGTQVASHIIVLEKHAQPPANLQQVNRDYRDAGDINDLFNRLESLELPPRAVPVQAQSTGQTQGDDQSPKYVTDEPEITYITKKGKTLLGVIAKNLTADQAKAIDPYTWKKDGGYFIRMQHVQRPGGEAKFSRRALPETLSPASVRAAIDASEGKGFAAALEKTGWFHIITGDQVPDDVRQQAQGDRIPAYTLNGEVYFVADEIMPNDSIPGLLRHEVAAHAMRLNKSDAEFRAILQAMRRLPGEKAARARAAVPKQTPGHLRNEEALGYFVEQNPTHSLTRRFLAWLRSAIRALARRLPGVERLRVVRWANTLSEDDLIAMANSALRSAVRWDGALTGEDWAKFHRAWHGSPHDHDRFSTGKIGTGEGAQAFGWGLYFTNAKDIAEWYKKKLEDKSADQNFKFMGHDPVSFMDRITNEVKFSSEQDKHTAESIVAGHVSLFTFNDVSVSESDIARAKGIINRSDLIEIGYPANKSDRVIELLNAAKPEDFTVYNTGKLYEVELAPTEDEYLDWHKPLSEQSDKVKDALQSSGINFPDKDWNTGKKIYEQSAPKGSYINTSERDKAASEYLHSLGIRGIRYPAEGQTGGKTGDRYNYVIFSDEDVSIVAKFSRRSSEPKTTPANAGLPETISVEGVERPTRNSEGRVIHPTEEGVRNFWRWFGDSKIIDKQGRPLIVYHGTIKDFSVFDDNSEKQTHLLNDGVHYFSVNKKLANKFTVNIKEYNKAINDWSESETKEDEARAESRIDNARMGGVIMLVYLKADTIEIIDKNKSSLSSWDAERNESSKENNAINRLKYGNIDGVVFKNVLDKGNIVDHIVVVRSSTQIKSAIGNTGAFSPTNPDIRFSRRAQIPVNQDLEDFKSRAGLRPEKRTLADRMRRLLDTLKDTEWRKAVQQGIFDSDAGIKFAEEALARELSAEESGWVAAKLSRSMPQAVMHLLAHGPVQYRGGVLQALTGKGLLDILSPIQDELEDFTSWMVARRADRLMGEGRERNFTRAMIDAGLALNANRPQDANGKTDFERVADQIRDLNYNVLQFAEDAGLISRDFKTILLQHGDYIPFYRMFEESVLSPKTKKALSHQSSGIRVLKGGESPLSDPLGNLIANWAHLLDAGLKNLALDKTLTNLDGTDFIDEVLPRERFKAKLIPNQQIKKLLGELGDNLTPAEQQAWEDTVDALPDRVFEGFRKLWAYETPTDPDIVRVMREGKPVFMRVADARLLTSLKGLQNPWRPDAVTQWMLNTARGFARVYTRLITSTPVFWARNWTRDSMQSWVINPQGFKMGLGSIRGIVQSMKEDPAFNAMSLAGGSFRHGYINANDPQALGDQVRRLLRERGMDQGKIDAFMRMVRLHPGDWLDMYQSVGDAFENANRRATYESTLKATGSEAAATFAARDLLDFSTRGSWHAVQALTAILPFFNARLQGLYKLGRSGALPGAATKYVMTKALTLAAVSMVLAVINAMDDDYDEIEEWEKDAFWHIKKPGTKDFFKIPKPFEIGFIFGTIPQRMVRGLMQRDDGRVLAEALARGLTDTLAFNPLQPQLTKPIQEILANKSEFTGRPIEGFGEQFKPASQRFNANTSEIAKQASKGLSKASDVMPEWAHAPDAFGMSPKRFEHLVRGYFGAVGTFMLQMGDAALVKAMGLPAKPAMTLNQTPLISSFYRANPAFSTKYQTELYDLARAADDAWKLYQEADTTKGRQRLLEDNPEINARGVLDSGRNRVRTYRKQMDAVITDPNMTPEEKRTAMEGLIMQRNQAARNAVEMAKARMRQ